ncbi:MAG TPA: glycine cleavage system aminomethyltransferase GcvT [Terriglobales bacterium]|nr:glycine cleavage system aminomethyltransferase GcvT [Terriglobales bacterium]
MATLTEAPKPDGGAPKTGAAPAAALRKTALNAVHRQLGARMVDFGGWDMPVEYPTFQGRPGGLINEHMAVRTAVGLFDVSHMGDLRITGPGALAAVQHAAMNDASTLVDGKAQYSALLYPEGTFVDDIILHKVAGDDYLIVINAGTREKDFTWVRDAARGFDCRVVDEGDRYTQLAIQGPQAQATLQKLTDFDLATLKSYTFGFGTVCGLANVMIARTGYTGEDGFEIYIPPDAATSTRVWNEVLEAGSEFGVLPCGLGARNTLRLEAKLPLYGHEISDSINVFEAGLDRWCKLEKHSDFIGKAALQKIKAAPLKRRLVGLEMTERGIGRDGYAVLDQRGNRIGEITSGSPAPFLKKNIALAYVPPEFADLETALKVEIRGQAVAAKVVPTPFYKKPKKS